MSETSRTERAVREWLASSGHPLSTESVINAVLDSVSDVGQETPLRSGRNVRRFASGGLVAAALIVAVVGFALVSRPGPAVGPATSPSPPVLAKG